MPVYTRHSEYDLYLPMWEAVRDCADGASAVKKKKTKYLPKPNPGDTTTENDDRYRAYIERANFVNFTGSTLDGMLGMVFRKKLSADLPVELEYLNENINGAGLRLDQGVRLIIGELVQTGRMGLLADYPSADEGISAASVEAMGLRANITMYDAESCINWRTTVVGSVSVLSLVVLKETKEIVGEDGYTVESKDYYRVLRLEDGIYAQILFNEKEEVVEYTYPRMSDGTHWKEIPFIFAGSENNDPCVDKSPLYDISEVNIAHYRNSADYEESCFIVGQPTPYISGLNQSWIEKVLKDGVLLGSRTAIMLPEGGTAGLIQADQNQMPREGMEMKQNQMVKIGARLIEDHGGNEVVDSVRIRYAGQTSKLGVIVGNTEAAIIKCLKWAQMFMGGSAEPSIEINKEFYDKTVDPQLVVAKIQLLDRGVIAKKDMRDGLRESGIIDEERTDEDIDLEAEDLDPLGGF